jgi:hypothetical protein
MSLRLCVQGLYHELEKVRRRFDCSDLLSPARMCKERGDEIGYAPYTVAGPNASDQM